MEVFQILVVVLAVFLSLCCAVFAWSCRPTGHRHLALEKRLRTLETEAAELQDGWSKVLALTKKINQREVMRERRQAEKDQPQADEESDEEWQARMNRELLMKQMRN